MMEVERGLRLQFGENVNVWCFCGNLVVDLFRFWERVHQQVCSECGALGLGYHGGRKTVGVQVSQLEEVWWV